MQTNAIRRTSQRATTVRNWMVEKANALNMWYNSKSGYYSQLCGFTVTWKTVVRINLLTILFLSAAIFAVYYLYVFPILASCAAWIVYRLNVDDKGYDNEND